MFELVAPYKPAGDQPQAIAALNKHLDRGDTFQTLLGVTGSGKTYTIANAIAHYQKPTLVIAHNKTLAAQLWTELKDFFPNNAVHYFVSYYDYYQPEAYIAATDTYIEKDLEINEEIDRLRHAATHAVLSRSDVIVVATVSCIYGLGSPERYLKGATPFTVGQIIKRSDLIRTLTGLYYERNDTEFRRGRLRVNGEVVDVYPADGESFVRFKLDFDTLASITTHHPVTQEETATDSTITIFPAKHFVTDQTEVPAILKQINNDLTTEVASFKNDGKLVEAQRLSQRTSFDLEMIREVGFVKGIENYSRYFDGRQPGTPPHVLMDYFPKDYLLVVDESHMTFPQVRGMHNGDRARKDSLINNGFRLKAAYDNRPLTFAEFEKRMGKTIAVSATPSDYELERASEVIELVVRPTGLIDPKIELLPTKNQVDDLLAQVRKRVANGERSLVTTLTKRMAEDLSEFMLEAGIKVQYLHSDIVTIERSTILHDLRRGKYDVIVGINLLREGLDLPEVSLVAILDADKEGFLRSRQALIQTIGRAARHQNGTVIMYADKITDSMRAAIDETDRRRHKQVAYNTLHHITPTSISKPLHTTLPEPEEVAKLTDEQVGRLDKKQRALIVEDLRDQMRTLAENLDFEAAAKIRDTIHKLTTD